MGNKGPLKVLNGTKLILDDHGNNLDSFRISLESFRFFRDPLLHKPVTNFIFLQVELKVVGLSLLHEGVAFENFPSTLSLAPNSGPHSVSLLGAPKEPGELKILGYTLNVLGVQSTCKLRGM